MKRFFWTIVVVGAAYYGFLRYPDLFFRHTVEHRNFVFRSVAPVDRPVAELVDGVISRLETVPFYSQERKFSVYLCGPGALYALLTPFCGDGAGCSYSLLPDRMVLSSTGPFSAGEPLLVRQALYDLVQEKHTVLQYHFLKDWKMEGYAESIGGETRGYAPEGICGNAELPDAFRLRLERRVAVELVMSDDRLGFIALLRSNYAYDSVKERMMKRYCSR